MNRKFGMISLVVIAIVTLAVAGTGLSSATRSRSRNGDLQITQFHHVVITGEDIRNLPSGENRIVQKIEGGDSSANVPTGKVIFKVDGVDRNTSVNLTKIGSGTFALPNTYGGVTDIKEGAQNSANSGLSKIGPGTLVLTSSNNAVVRGESLLLSGTGFGVVYEFRNVRLTDLDRIVVPNEGLSIAARILGLRKAQLAAAGATKSGILKRVLYGPAKGIAQIEGWKADSKPGSKYSCGTAGCTCSGGSDCLKLADLCRSELTCDQSGNCFCTK